VQNDLCGVKQGHATIETGVTCFLPFESEGGTLVTRKYEKPYWEAFILALTNIHDNDVDDDDDDDKSEMVAYMCSKFINFVSPCRGIYFPRFYSYFHCLHWRMMYRCSKTRRGEKVKTTCRYSRCSNCVII